MIEYMLTTIDNPFDPFDQFDEWYNFDETKGYCTCGLIARIAKTSDSLPESMNLEEIYRAFDEIIDMNSEFYKKIEKNDEKIDKNDEKTN